MVELTIGTRYRQMAYVMPQMRAISRETIPKPSPIPHFDRVYVHELQSDYGRFSRLEVRETVSPFFLPSKRFVIYFQVTLTRKIFALFHRHPLIVSNRSFPFRSAVRKLSVSPTGVCLKKKKKKMTRKVRDERSPPLVLAKRFTECKVLLKRPPRRP